MRLVLPDGTVDTDNGELSRGGEVVRLSPRERELLDYLAQRPGEVVSTEELLRVVWGCGPHVVTRAVFHTMRRLRARIEPDPAQPRFLLAERGIGYRFVAPAGTVAAAAPTVPGAAPSAAGPLHGREEDLRRVAEALTRPARLLHLVGPPGVGKTRLARELCRAPSWRFVSLEPEPTRARLEGALLSALGVSAAGSLQAALSDGGVGLVLDGVERLPAGAEAWLPIEGPPRVVVTGREPFDLVGERVVHVSRLPAQAGAQLFAEAVRLGLGAEAVPPPEELAAAVEALDGLPLALEVAAAQLHDLPLPLVLARLTRDDAGTSPLDRALSVSWELASPRVRAALVRLAVWEGAVPLDEVRAVGVSVADAEAVVRASLGEWAAPRRSQAPAAPTNGQVPPGRALRLYAVVRRFVRRIAEPAALEAAAAARLAALARHGAVTELARVHEHGGRRAAALLAVLTDLGAAADAGRAPGPSDTDEGRADPGVLARKGEPEVPAAVLRALAVGSLLAGGFATVGPLIRERVRRAGGPAERRALLAFIAPLEWAARLGLPAEELLADVLPARAAGHPPPDAEERATRILHHWQAALALHLDARLAESAARFGGLAADAAAEGWPGLVGLARCYEGSALRQLGRFPEALRAFEDAARALDEAGDGRGLAELRNSEGAARIETGELDLARLAFVDAGEAARRAGDERLLMRVDGILSIVERMRGDLAAAEVHARAVIERARRVGARDTEGATRLNLAVTHVDQGRLDEALSELEQARRLLALSGSARPQVMLAINWGLTRLAAGRWDLDDLPELYPAGLVLGWRTELVAFLVWVGRVGRGACPPEPAPSEPAEAPHEALALCLAWASVAARRAGDEAAAARLRLRSERLLTPALSPYLRGRIERVFHEVGG